MLGTIKTVQADEVMLDNDTLNGFSSSSADGE